MCCRYRYVVIDVTPVTVSIRMSAIAVEPQGSIEEPAGTIWCRDADGYRLADQALVDGIYVVQALRGGIAA